MPRRRSFPKGAAGRLKKLLDESRDIAEYRRIQSCWLRASMDLSNKEISQATGLPIRSIRQYHHFYMKHGESYLLKGNKGGRYRENMSVEEERQFLKDFEKKASTGGMLVISEVKEAYEKRIGQVVALSTVYRVLARHGWRKIVPRRKHPKGDREEQESFKKTLIS